MEQPFLVVGAGLSGATVARVLAEAGLPVLVIDARDHVAGNCHTEVDPETGVLVHRYGPHIFHTDEERIWNFLARFTEFSPYRHKVFARAGGQIYRLPINLHTLSQFFRRSFTPEEARRHLEAIAEPSERPENFEELALAMVGRDLYETFLRGYTMKQWGVDPKAIPAAVLKRLPLRFSFDDNYFHHARQAMPTHGYTAMVQNMLIHENVTLELKTPYEMVADRAWRHVFHTGPIDCYFEHRFGPLSYRTLRFEAVRGVGDMQGTAVVNHCDAATPYTRVTEHRHLSPWRAQGDGGICTYETSHAAGPGDILYYPVGLAADKAMLARYQALAKETPGVTFLGRLGGYAYIDMDRAVSRALDLTEAFLETLANRQSPSA